MCVENLSLDKECNTSAPCQQTRLTGVLPNKRVGNTGAQVVCPTPNQDARDPKGPPGDDGAPAADTAAAGLEKT